MKVKFTIFRGNENLFYGILKSNPTHYGDDHLGVLDEDKMEEFFKDALNIERYINTQGTYRCHVEEV